jgi:iron complex transport system ATP-binding protein
MDSGRGGGKAAVLHAAQVVLGGRTVLGPLSAEIARGEHWALLGPNGAGKTVLLSLLGAERHPTKGSVEVLGERLGRVDLGALRRRIGYVGHRVADRLPPGATALEVVLTGEEGLLAPWWGRFDERARAAAAATLARVGCDQLAEQPYGQCSQGERQRVLVARSLFGRHELLLLDEPALGVDLPGREALIGVLDELAGPDGPTTVHVAHTLEELPGLTTHAMLLARGQLVASGAAAEVLVDAALSECFGAAFVVERVGGRYSAHAARSW